MSNLSGFGLLGGSVCAGVFVMVTKRGEQVRQVVIVKGVVGVAALATNVDEVQLTEESKLVGGRALGHAGAQLGHLLTPGALADALKAVAYFDGARALGPLVVLATIALIGLGLEALAERRNVDAAAPG